MEQLPYIDEHSIVIGATREHVWQALTSTLHTNLGTSVPEPLVGLLRVVPTQSSGDWRGTVHRGDTLPGFVVAEADAPKRLALRGGHRFSSYALVFELDQSNPRYCTLRAQTRAAFPGFTGYVYRALVIGTGGHRVVIRRMLRNVARHI